MTSKHWLRKRLTHTCTVERDSGTAQSASGQVSEDWTDVGTAQKCRYYEGTERIASESLGLITVKTRTVMFDADQDIETNDRLTDIKDKDGITIQAGPIGVEHVSARKDLKGNVYFKVAGLEKVETS